MPGSLETDWQLAGGGSLAVREAGAADVPRLAEVLKHAFRRDPVHRWLLPDDSEWKRGSAGFWTELLRHALRHGVVLTTAGFEGTALWLPPHPTHDGFVQDLLFTAHMLLILRRRAWRGRRVATAIKANFPPQPHWYLAVLGTDPTHQGKGVSGAVMGAVLRRCDADGVPAYLESSNPANVPLYQRRGFAVTGEIALPGGPTIWPMFRAPRR